uniref:molybdopterin-guanine dinucleotide biosynthesis protein MobB n=1 Tax=Enterobacter sp. IF2SW-P2 TaxID=1841144 RepID=UPI000A5C79F8
TMVASNQRWALMTETPDEAPLDLAYLVSRMDHSTLDLVLVEGFKHEAEPNILLFSSDGGHDISELPLDEHVLAVASDVALDIEGPVLDLNEEDGIAEFIEKWCAV